MSIPAMSNLSMFIPFSLIKPDRVDAGPANLALELELVDGLSPSTGYQRLSDRCPNPSCWGPPLHHAECIGEKCLFRPSHRLGADRSPESTAAPIRSSSRSAAPSRRF